jgi:hypothetical protein
MIINEFKLKLINPYVFIFVVALILTVIRRLF